MSLSTRHAQRSGMRPSKRRKTAVAQPVDEDLPTPQSQAEAPSATALSTRVLPLTHIPPLSTTCVRVFAQNLQKLSANTSDWENVRLWLKTLPDTLATKVFTALKAICPTLLSHGFIITYLLRGQSIGLSSNMPGVKRMTVLAIADSSMSANLLELELSGFSKESDGLFASVVSRLPSLRVLNLRGCAKAGQTTVEAVAKNCIHLKVVNLKYTAVPPVSLAPLLLACRDLEVLKVAGIPNWTDASFVKLSAVLEKQEDFQLKNLRTLNVRQSALSDSALSPFLMACPNLKRLDLSFTHTHNPKYLLGRAALEKLSLTSTAVTAAALLEIIPTLTGLTTLNIGALGGGQGTVREISNSSAMTMTDQYLNTLTETLAGFPKLERINIVGNAKLGLTGRGDGVLANFVQRVGRKCTVLNMAGIPSLRSSDLAGLFPEERDGGSSPLQVLNLNHTAINDEAAPYIASCPALQTLSLAGTKVTNAGLYPIIDACVHLAELDLTSCRGVGVVDRRRFFEVWEKEWKG